MSNPNSYDSNQTILVSGYLWYICWTRGVFDAPLDKVWKYLRSDDHKHPSLKLISRELNGNVVVITAERNVMGKMVTVQIKNTLYPPFGWVQEHIEGPTKGSKAFVYYIPKEGKTGVTVVGDFHVEGAGEKQTIDAIMTQSQVVFDEDNENMKKMK